ncbi:Coatomer subunit alpha-2 [Tritrichomonas foetus]|uniref:Beta'-coat protein n=1 Tax=Tritrichomonas foetus TaxID=1144522 RepID=A0A1J4JCK2_9EUKA|nr:Coatomer subunit alpha-2 [Tritrichomonas foetus]|eukprot:OHS95387.1 Coatomer subunit alpha-2 [Tritrichomonas foetus]
MYVKFDKEANRVKGLCFHPQRTWLLASFHSGEIVIYDYEAGVMLQKYTDHTVPVRSVDFHPTQPLFCSGSDDNSVKVFNYEKQRCLYTFKEHLDFVRTVQFHHVHPYIVSSSDDMTIRIFNWETRTQVTTIPGHNHYVMSAFFHPTMPWILSASLDDTVRVWDVSALFNNNQPTGIFALTDTVIKYQQEEHISGVNWASWHPNRQLAVSCSDDQTVKIWKINESDMSVIATLRSHSNNVSCAIYHPLVDVVISASEDNTIRLWDSKRFLHLAKYRRSGDRFWILAAHPTLPLFAAGHDSGLTVFRLMRQRPTLDVSGNDIIYYKDNSIKKYNADSQSECTVGATKPRNSGNRASPLDPPPRTFSYNAAQNKLLVGFEDKFELHQLGGVGTSELKVETGCEPIWISRNQFAYLNPDNKAQLNVREASGTTVIKLTIPLTNKLFPASPSHLYLATPDSIILFDVTRRQQVSKRSVGNVRHAYISPDRRKVAFLTKNAVTICSIDLSKASTFHDGASVKSGAWREDFFIYSTKTHIKYFLANGDSGIIRSVGSRVYIASVGEKQVICINTANEVRRLDVDLTECRFKAALAEGNMGKVTSILRTAKLCSESIIDYLQKRGHPEVALLFVQDPEAKFRLALEAGDLKVAVEAAAQINDPVVWESLADEAMLHGLFSVAEVALQRSGNTERLAFFYLISGQADKMNNVKGDESLALQRAIWTNDRNTIGNLLKDAAPPLSTIALRDSLEPENIPEQFREACSTIGKPDLTNHALNNGSSEDWPLLFVSRPTFEINKEASDDEVGAGWDDDDDDDLLLGDEVGKSKARKGENDSDLGDEDGWGLDDIDDLDNELAEAAANSASVYIPPTNGTSPHDEWSEFSNVPGEIAAAGYFGQALDELHSQIALIDAAPLRNAFVTAYIASHASVPTFPSSPSLSVPLGMRFAERNSVPSVPSYIDLLRQKINVGYVEFSKANFAASQEAFLSALQCIPLAVCNTIEEENEVVSHIETCRQYLTGLMLENEMSSENDKQRHLELAAYFTHCQLQQKHVSLTLKKAMTIAFKEKNYQLVLEFGGRLSKIIKLPDKVQKMMAVSQTLSAKQNSPKINYDPRNPFDVCCKSLTPIYRGSQKAICPFCGACYTPANSGTKCTVCQMCQVGANDATGLKLVRPKRNRK